MKRVYVLGDIHFNQYNTIRYWINHYELKDIIIIQVGDFGVGFRKKDIEYLEDLNKFLQENNVIVYAIRGNHDDPEFFKGEWYDKFSNLHLVPDYTILDLNNRNYLLVGGAISIDRVELQFKEAEQQIPYWFKDEVFVKATNEQHKMIMETDIDYVVTHTCPNFAWPLDLSPIVYKHANNDPDLLKDLRVERQAVADLYETISMKSNIKKWYYGHYHNSQMTGFRGTDFHLIGIDELKEVR